MKIIIHKEAQTCLEEIVSSARLDQALLEIFLTDFIVCLYHLGDLAEVLNQDGKVSPLRIHLIGVAELVINFIEASSLFIELSRLFVIVVLLKFVSTVFAHAAGLRHATHHLVKLDSLLNELKVLLSITLLHTQGRLLKVVSLETFIFFALNTFHVHGDGLLRVFRVLVAIGCLLIQIFCIVLPVSF